MAAKYGGRAYDTAEELLADPAIDAVSVCAANYAHAELTIKALRAGKHVLCEKPMALNAEEARQMKEAADRNGKLLMIGFVRRYGNDCKIMEDFVNSGYFGDIYYSKATYLRRNGNPGGWFGDKSRSGGGPLIDLGVHVIDLTRYLMGKPRYPSTALPSRSSSTAPTSSAMARHIPLPLVKKRSSATLKIWQRP